MKKFSEKLSIHKKEDLNTMAGVYFLMDIDSNVVYIGSSTNVYNRIREHKKTKDFVYFSIIPIDPDVYPLREIEADLIAEYLPPLNKTIGKSTRFAQASTIKESEHRYYHNIFILNGIKYIDLSSRVMGEDYVKNYLKAQFESK